MTGAALSWLPAIALASKTHRHDLVADSRHDLVADSWHDLVADLDQPMYGRAEDFLLLDDRSDPTEHECAYET